MHPGYLLVNISYVLKTGYPYLYLKKVRIDGTIGELAGTVGTHYRETGNRFAVKLNSVI